MPKQTKKELQEILLEQITLNRDLVQRLQNMEARMQNMANVPIPRPISPPILPQAYSNQPPPYISSATDSPNHLMMETARIIQDSSTVEKTSPFLDGVDEALWHVFSLKFIHYRTKGGKKPTRDLLSPSVLNYYSM